MDNSRAEIDNVNIAGVNFDRYFCVERPRGADGADDFAVGPNGKEVTVMSSSGADQRFPFTFVFDENAGARQIHDRAITTAVKVLI